MKKFEESNFFDNKIWDNKKRSKILDDKNNSFIQFDIENIFKFLRTTSEYKELDQKKIHVKLIFKILTIFYKLKELFNNTVNSIESLRFGKNSRKAFNLMKKIFKYDQFERPGGSIVTAVKVKDQIIYDKRKVARLIIEHFNENHKPKTKETNVRDIMFPHLPRLSVETIKGLSYNFAKDKAIAWDGISDRIFKLHPGCYKRNTECQECKKK